MLRVLSSQLFVTWQFLQLPAATAGGAELKSARAPLKWQPRMRMFCAGAPLGESSDAPFYGDTIVKGLLTTALPVDSCRVGPHESQTIAEWSLRRTTAPLVVAG